MGCEFKRGRRDLARISSITATGEEKKEQGTAGITAVKIEQRGEAKRLMISAASGDRRTVKKTK